MERPGAVSGHPVKTFLPLLTPDLALHPREDDSVFVKKGRGGNGFARTEFAEIVRIGPDPDREIGNGVAWVKRMKKTAPDETGVPGPGDLS